MVLVQLGTPNSRILYAAHVRDARERGLRLIAYDRPGYGGSTPRPGRAIVDCVSDVRAIMDALGVERFATWGISGGGPHPFGVRRWIARPRGGGGDPGLDGAGRRARP